MTQMFTVIPVFAAPPDSPPRPKNETKQRYIYTQPTRYEHYALGYMSTDALWFASTFEPGTPPRVDLG